ncbi:MAG: UDP-N-acetylglucosamine--N-acetylmuramyl-(pentapeptide) pyrophosphoryl-undecaprenol N-acetylglucosamine transferase [Candidatus Baltobacteraceae bacterium]
MTVVFAGGGTGGHLYPAIAIADALRERRARIAFVGTADRLEATIVPKAGYQLYTIASRALPRRPSFDFVRTIAANVKGTLQSLRLLALARPDLVIATGGYVAFPVALAARIRRLTRRSTAPIVLLEPNAAPGLTNRLLGPIVDEVWNVFGAGVPIRAALRELPPRHEALARLGLDPACKTLVAVGGSQGARAINNALVAMTAEHRLPPGWQLLHLTGRDEYERVRAALERLDGDARKRHMALAYLDEMADAYAAADLMVARAGASTLGELAAVGKPAILVPYPFATQRHQTENASRFEKAGAAVVVTDRDLEAGALPALLARTMEPQRLAALSEGARRLTGSDPLVEILARIDALVPRRSDS